VFPGDIMVLPITKENEGEEVDGSCLFVSILNPKFETNQRRLSLVDFVTQWEKVRDRRFK
jgi:hypothetical protein